MKTILCSILERLKPLRKQKGLTQKQMAEILQVTESHYQKIEYGKVNLPATTLIELSIFFKVSTDYLLGLSDQP